MVIMKDPCNKKCPYCNAVITHNEDSFCHNCLESLPDPELGKIMCAGF